MSDCFVSSNVQGIDIRGTVLRFEPFQVVFELYRPELVLRVSEVLGDFRVFLEGELAYAGRAVVTNLLRLGATAACEVKLEDPGLQAHVPLDEHSSLQAYNRAVDRWQAHLKIEPRFKSALVDLHAYLSELKLFLERTELSILAHPARSRSEMEQQVLHQLSTPVLSVIDALRDRFLEAAHAIPAELLPVHESLTRRLLHPLFLCAPFGFRTYQKPLGYAGDYEMMNMIHRNAFEGASLFAKVVHYWLINQAPARSVRNRIGFMKNKLLEQTLRRHRQQRPARVLNLGCGPAREIRDFLTESALADHADFTLLDFDSETLQYASTTLTQAKLAQGRRTPIQVRRLSTTQLLKEASRNQVGMEFDFVYCGGLFDYLTHRICRQLTATLYESLAPGGQLVVANMDNRVPFSRMMEFLLDWHLLYRDSNDMASLVPPATPPDGWTVISDDAAVHLFLELRKPEKN